MYGIEKYTCVRFMKRSNEEDYLNIVSGGGCSSFMGKVGGKVSSSIDILTSMAYLTCLLVKFISIIYLQQDVSLKQNGCLIKGTIQHELIHALGESYQHTWYKCSNYYYNLIV